jgi:hypothetical protein
VTQADEAVLVTSGASGDTEMWLYGPNSLTRQVAHDDDSGPGLFSRIESRGAGSLPVGTYFVKVTAKKTAIPNFTLSLRGGKYSSAFTMGTLSGGKPISGDSFRVPNLTGVCFGMSAYSKWYFDDVSGTHGPLSTHFSSDAVQTAIAKQAHADLAASNVILWDILVGGSSDNYGVAEKLIADLKQDHSPQILLMSKSQYDVNSTWEIWYHKFFNKDEAHAVLVMDYQEDFGKGQGKFLIYNNWFTDRTSNLTFSGNNLSGFSDQPAYKFFLFAPARAVYNSSTFTGSKYPTP